MKESQYLDAKCVFVSVLPEQDTPKKMREFGSIFDKNLILLREKSNKS